MTSCAAQQYKKADLSIYGGRTGYLEKEIKLGVFVLEYAQIGGYNFNLELNKKYWVKRAYELCPNGYDGEYKIIHPMDAKIKEFECPQRFCSKYPLVSGVIECKSKTNKALQPMQKSHG